MQHTLNDSSFSRQPDGTIVEAVSDTHRNVHHRALPDIGIATQLLNITFAEHDTWQAAHFDGMTQSQIQGYDYEATRIHFHVDAPPAQRTVARQFMDGWGGLSVVANGTQIECSDPGTELEIAWVVYRMRPSDSFTRHEFYGRGQLTRSGATDPVELDLASLPAGTYRAYLYQWQAGYRSGYAEVTV